MAALLRIQAVARLKSLLSPFYRIGSTLNDHGVGRSAMDVAEPYIHIEPTLNPNPQFNLERDPTRATETPHSQAMTNRDERRAPVLHAGESAQGRLF